MHLKFHKNNLPAGEAISLLCWGQLLLLSAKLLICSRLPFSACWEKSSGSSTCSSVSSSLFSGLTCWTGRKKILAGKPRTELDVSKKTGYLVVHSRKWRNSGRCQLCQLQTCLAKKKGSHLFTYPEKCVQKFSVSEKFRKKGASFQKSVYVDNWLQPRKTNNNVLKINIIIQITINTMFNNNF